MRKEYDFSDGVRGKHDMKECGWCAKSFRPDPELVGDVSNFCSPACYEAWIDERMRLEY